MLPYRQAMRRRVDRDVDDVVSRRNALDLFGLPLEILAVAADFLEHAELAAGPVGQRDDSERGIVAALLVRIVTDRHRALSERAPPGVFDLAGLETLPGVKVFTAHPAANAPGDTSPGLTRSSVV